MAQERVALPDPGDIAGRYEVVQKLGAGAFGTVYKAKDRLLGRPARVFAAIDGYEEGPLRGSGQVDHVLRHTGAG